MVNICINKAVLNQANEFPRLPKKVGPDDIKLLENAARTNMNKKL